MRRRMRDREARLARIRAEPGSRNRETGIQRRGDSDSRDSWAEGEWPLTSGSRRVEGAVGLWLLRRHSSGSETACLSLHLTGLSVPPPHSLSVPPPHSQPVCLSSSQPGETACLSLHLTARAVKGSRADPRSPRRPPAAAPTHGRRADPRALLAAPVLTPAAAYVRRLRHLSARPLPRSSPAVQALPATFSVAPAIAAAGTRKTLSEGDPGRSPTKTQRGLWGPGRWAQRIPTADWSIEQHGGESLLLFILITSQPHCIVFFTEPPLPP
ncbi:unnamed protein product [Boreogadus saida]